MYVIYFRTNGVAPNLINSIYLRENAEEAMKLVRRVQATCRRYISDIVILVHDVDQDGDLFEYRRRFSENRLFHAQWAPKGDGWIENFYHGFDQQVSVELRTNPHSVPVSTSV